MIQREFWQERNFGSGGSSAQGFKKHLNAMRQTFLDLHFDTGSVFTVDPQRVRWDGYPMRLTDHLMTTLAERAWGSDASGVWHGEAKT